ncbi:MAG: hypothetical protein K2W96_10215 [Gemmataceae bacterium]|nr:hypothetical protein [Gemmataceae bacterium]
MVGTVLVHATLVFRKDGGGHATVGGPYLAFQEAASDDEDILGRDVTNNFISISDYPNKRVLLLGAPHGYAVTAPASRCVNGPWPRPAVG